MKIYKEKDYEAMSRRAADIVAAHIILKPDCVLGLATGSTPLGLYKELIRRYRSGSLDFSGVKTVNLDEYVGLSASDKESYRYYMRTNFFDHVNVQPNNVNVPDGTADPDSECRRYNRILYSYGNIDLQVLGLGHNGHIGFNEPADVFKDDTHVVRLTRSTLNANSRFFSSQSEMPSLAITMGVGTIMRASAVLMLVSGKEKAEIVGEVFKGPVTPKVPASILQFHPNLILVGDEAALGKLRQ